MVGRMADWKKNSMMMSMLTAVDLGGRYMASAAVVMSPIWKKRRR